MRNLLKTLVLIVSISQVLTAQHGMADSSFGTDIKFGAKAGLNFATLTGDLEDVKGRTSFHFGGIAEIIINEEFAVQPELLYSAQGAKYDDATFALDYLYVPIMGKYFINDEFSLEAGPQFGYLLSAKLKDKSSGNGGNGGNIDTTSRGSQVGEVAASNEDIKDGVKSFDFGLNIGASYILKNGINLSLRYYLGLANGNNLEDNDGDFKNSVFQLSVSYFFN